MTYQRTANKPSPGSASELIHTIVADVLQVYEANPRIKYCVTTIENITMYLFTKHLGDSLPDQRLFPLTTEKCHCHAHCEDPESLYQSPKESLIKRLSEYYLNHHTLGGCNPDRVPYIQAKREPVPESLAWDPLVPGELHLAYLLAHYCKVVREDLVWSEPYHPTAYVAGDIAAEIGDAGYSFFVAMKMLIEDTVDQALKHVRWPPILAALETFFRVAYELYVAGVNILRGSTLGARSIYGPPADKLQLARDQIDRLAKRINKWFPKYRELPDLTNLRNAHKTLEDLIKQKESMAPDASMLAGVEGRVSKPRGSVWGDHVPFVIPPAFPTNAPEATRLGINGDSNYPGNPYEIMQGSDEQPKPVDDLEEFARKHWPSDLPVYK